MNQMSNEYTAALLAGFDILSESLKVGERMWIDDNIYWIRLYEPEAGPFKIKFYKVDTRYTQPPVIERQILFLVNFDGWEFPKAAYVYWAPGEGLNRGSISRYYAVRIPGKDSNGDKKDLVLHTPVKDNPEWCLGVIVECIGSVED